MSSPFFQSRLTLQIANRFENYVFELLKKEYGGCAITRQFRLDSGLIPDFVIECDRKLIVADAKSKEILTKKDIEQVIEYMIELDADSAFIYVRDFTEVSDLVENYAVLNAIDIIHVDW